MMEHTAPAGNFRKTGIRPSVDVVFRDDHPGSRIVEADRLLDFGSPVGLWEESQRRLYRRSEPNA